MKTFRWFLFLLFWKIISHQTSVQVFNLCVHAQNYTLDSLYTRMCRTSVVYVHKYLYICAHLPISPQPRLKSAATTGQCVSRIEKIPLFDSVSGSPLSEQSYFAHQHSRSPVRFLLGQAEKLKQLISMKGRRTSEKLYIYPIGYLVGNMHVYY